jgi:pyruvate carboxylase
MVRRSGLGEPVRRRAVPGRCLHEDSTHDPQDSLRPPLGRRHVLAAGPARGRAVTPRRIGTLLVANRSEIAIRVMRAASELDIRTVAIYSHEDRFALHRFKADASFQVGAGRGPLEAYLDVDDILRVARRSGADAVHPGYGFLAESPAFATACAQAGLVFVGPDARLMALLGNKVAARAAAVEAGVPVVPATGPLPADFDACVALAREVGYPLMLKASWGGGGRGMRVIAGDDDLLSLLPVARREAAAAFGSDEVYLEKLVQRAHHVEVQILGDLHGQLVHLFERDCSVQRRHQKVVERAPAPYLDDATRTDLCEAALRLARAVGYTHAGTVEFLLDADARRFYFIEVNPRIQVEHTVTEAVTGIDLVKAQIRISEGARIGDLEDRAAADRSAWVPGSGVPVQADIRLSGHALQCRVTAEDPEKGFLPDHGRIVAYRSASGFGIRLDAGTAYTGAVITPYYDSLLVKVTAWAPSAGDAIRRMDRALREFRIRGVATNLPFVTNVINHPDFVSGAATTRFVDETPALLRFPERRDRATKLLRFLGDVTVYGQPDLKGRASPSSRPIDPTPPGVDASASPPEGSRDRLRRLGADGFARWMATQSRVGVTDTTMRDAHQSLLATRVRTRDLLAIAPYYAHRLSGLFSIECWGGATFDVAMRFLREDPWQRLAQLREAIPNVMLQMLLRGANGVGYTSYPDDVVRLFIRQAAREGVDLFRVFDSLNWVDNMRVAIDAVLETGALCEGAICYTGDLLDAARPKYDLAYYLRIARELQRAGVHVLAVKDMAGVCRPRAAAELVRALREETGLPIHFHTHDTSGAAAASVLAAVDAGAAVIDAAMGAMSGLTSQPNLGSLVAALAGGPRDTGLDGEALEVASGYWEGVRRLYAPYESDVRAGTADVYRHEMPGGQYTNLREQARAMGLESRWPEVSRAYADASRLFGDLVKVTPTSKVVGDMALFMVANGLDATQVADPDRPIAFPESVESLFAGELGFPPEGFPAALSRKVLGREPPAPYRPGEVMSPPSLGAASEQAAGAAQRAVDERDVVSWLTYPKVFAEFAAHQRRYGDVSVLPTSVWMYGMREHEELSVELDPGKRVLVRLLGTSPPNEDGAVKLFFELNGQSRTLRVDLAAPATRARRPKTSGEDASQVGAPMTGVVVSLAVSAGQKVRAGDPLLTLEAMKMATQLRAERDGVVASVHVRAGDAVESGDLLVEVS